MRATERLIELAASLSPTGTIGDGMVAQLREAAAGARGDQDDYRTVAHDEARKRIVAEIALNRLVKALRMGAHVGDRSAVVSSALEQADQVLNAVNEPPAPIPMILHCPKCHTQHVDRPVPGWENPPHRSHLCHACGCAWRPADVATVGVAAIETVGKADNWLPTGERLHLEAITESTSASAAAAIAAGHAETIADAGAASLAEDHSLSARSWGKGRHGSMPTTEGAEGRNWAGE